MNYINWLTQNTFSLEGKTIAITGATGGIGIHLCEYFAQLGADIICLDRNEQKSNKLIEKLLLKYPQRNIYHLTLDLENFDNVVAVTQQLKTLEIDYLVLNAGAYKIPRHKCTTGFDNVFQINFLSPYYMACELSSYISQKNGRVVAVSSIAHNYSSIDIDDVDFSTREKSSLVYGNAKRFLTLSLFEHFKCNDTLSIVHPGITFTNITAHYPKLVYVFIKHPMKLIFMPAKKAALSILFGLFNSTQTGEWIGPRYFNIWGVPCKKSLKTYNDFELKKAAEIARKIYIQIKKERHI